MIKLLVGCAAAYVGLGLLSAAFHLRWTFKGKRYKQLRDYDKELIHIVIAFPLCYWLAFGYYYLTDGIKAHRKRLKNPSILNISSD